MVLKLQKTLDNLLPDTIKLVENVSQLDLSSKPIKVKVLGRSEVYKELKEDKNYDSKNKLTNGLFTLGSSFQDLFCSVGSYNNSLERIRFIKENLGFKMSKKGLQTILAHELVHVAQFRNFPDFMSRYVASFHEQSKTKIQIKNFEVYSSFIEYDANKIEKELFPEQTIQPSISTAILSLGYFSCKSALSFARFLPKQEDSSKICENKMEELLENTNWKNSRKIIKGIYELPEERFLELFYKKR